MALRVEKLQLGRCNATAFDQGSEGWAIVLPGAGYSAQVPVLWFARRAALQARYSALAVTDVFDLATIRFGGSRSELTPRWHTFVQRTRTPSSARSPDLACGGRGSRGTSLAVWFAPLIGEPEILAGVRAGTDPKLLIGGSDDPSWDATAAGTVPNADILELAGANHSLEAPNDLSESLANQTAPRTQYASSSLASATGGGPQGWNLDRRSEWGSRPACARASSFD